MERHSLNVESLLDCPSEGAPGSIGGNACFIAEGAERKKDGEGGQRVSVYCAAAEVALITCMRRKYQVSTLTFSFCIVHIPLMLMTFLCIGHVPPGPLRNSGATVAVRARQSCKAPLFFCDIPRSAGHRCGASRVAPASKYLSEDISKGTGGLPLS